MKKQLSAIIGIFLFFCHATDAHAATDDSLDGTYTIEFQPIQSAGKLQGCSLVYSAAALDYTYKQGELLSLKGNISIFGDEKGMLLNFKIGVVENLAKNPTFVEPHFAYLQTSNSSTNEVESKSFASDIPGYKIFVYSLFEPNITKLYEDMISSGKVTIGFNRKANGMDILVPLNLFIRDARLEGNAVKREHSMEMLNAFSSCSSKLIDSVLKKLQEKPN